MAIVTTRMEAQDRPAQTQTPARRRPTSEGSEAAEGAGGEPTAAAAAAAAEEEEEEEEAVVAAAVAMAMTGGVAVTATATGMTKAGMAVLHMAGMVPAVATAKAAAGAVVACR